MRLKATSTNHYRLEDLAGKVRLESGEAVALKVSHEEDVSGWMSAIAQYLEGAEGAVSFADLVKGLRMPVVAVWLGLLLGEFRVEQRGGFYDQEIWVGC